MNSVNLTASVSNLTQVDRLQHDAHRTPVINQDQNAAIARREAEQRIDMPVQPDEVSGKNVDPDDRRRQQRTPLRKRKRNGIDPSRSARSNYLSGNSIDINA